MRRGTRGIRGLFGVALPVALTMSLTIALAPSAQAARTRDLFNGNGFGSYAFVGQTAMSGRTALVSLGCQTTPGTHVENSMQSNQEEEKNTGGSMSTGSVKTSSDAIQNAETRKTLSTSTAHGVNLLKGRITASRVRAVSATYTSGKKIKTSAAGTLLSDLVVDGDAFKVEPGPNTRVTIPKVGYAILNEQFSSTDGPKPFLRVNGIHVYVTQPNSLGIPVGTQYIVAQAFSSFKPNVTGVVGGVAFGHRLFEGSRAQSGPSAIVSMPCAGTGGKVFENSLGGAGRAPTFQLGEVRNTAMGRVGSKTATAQTTSSVQSVNLLKGLITADLVRAVAGGSKKGKARSFTDAGSTFVNLVVAGRRIGNETGRNRAIQLPGIGTLWLHHVVPVKGGIEIRMIDLEVKEENPFNLKPGSKLQVAVARILVVS